MGHHVVPAIYLQPVRVSEKFCRRYKFYARFCFAECMKGLQLLRSKILAQYIIAISEVATSATKRHSVTTTNSGLNNSGKC